jgi:hypothetical protein
MLFLCCKPLPTSPSCIVGFDNNSGMCAFGAPNHQNKEPPFSIDNFTYDFQQSFSEPFSAQHSTADTSQEESMLLSDRCMLSSSHGKVNANYLLLRLKKCYKQLRTTSATTLVCQSNHFGLGKSHMAISHQFHVHLALSSMSQGGANVIRVSGVLLCTVEVHCMLFRVLGL